MNLWVACYNAVIITNLPVLSSISETSLKIVSLFKAVGYDIQVLTNWSAVDLYFRLALAANWALPPGQQ